jgi:hypothetical protein
MGANGNGSRQAPAAGKHLSSGLYVRAAPGLRLRDKKVERLVRKMRMVMHWLEPSDFATCRACAELEILAGQVYATLRVAARPVVADARMPVWLGVDASGLAALEVLDNFGHVTVIRLSKLERNPKLNS